VLRAFENNLLPYLCNLGLDTPLKDEVEQFELSLKQRYQDAMSIISGIDYKNAYPVVYDHIEEEELSQNNEQEFINSLNNFHNQLKSLNIKHSLATIDLVEYQKDNRAIAYKYLSKGELVGHNIGMFFTVPTLENELDRTKKQRLPIDTIDLRLTKPLREKGVYSYYAISQHSKNERVFRKQLHTEFTFLAQNAHIHHYYASVTLKSSVDVMFKMGFSVAAYEGESPVGAIKVGAKRYTRAIMYIETSELFIQPEFLYLLTCCGVCTHRQCDSCTEHPNCIC
jgi:hypothetical protein